MRLRMLISAAVTEGTWNACFPFWKRLLLSCLNSLNLTSRPRSARFSISAPRIPTHAQVPPSSVNARRSIQKKKSLKITWRRFWKRQLWNVLESTQSPQKGEPLRLLFKSSPTLWKPQSYLSADRNFCSKSFFFSSFPFLNQFSVPHESRHKSCWHTLYAMPRSSSVLMISKADTHNMEACA